jgi:hypothetical protein
MLAERVSALMSRKPRSRQRKILITDDVVELFRKAQTAWFSWSGSHGNSKERTKALDLIKAFDAATGNVPWEHSLLSPRRDGDPLRIALLAKLSKAEAEE